MPQRAGQIEFFSDGIRFSIRNKTALRKWLIAIARSHNLKVEHLTYIFKSDEGLLEMNRRFLNHNTLTDIITFPMDSSRGAIAGEIYISIDRVKDNAAKYNQTFNDELGRVMAHGLLHLCGFKDKSAAQAKRMRAEEEKALDLRSN